MYKPVKACQTISVWGFSTVKWRCLPIQLVGLVSMGMWKCCKSNYHNLQFILILQFNIKILPNCGLKGARVGHYVWFVCIVIILGSDGKQASWGLEASAWHVHRHTLLEKNDTWGFETPSGITSHTVSTTPSNTHANSHAHIHPHTRSSLFLLNIGFDLSESWM